MAVFFFNPAIFSPMDTVGSSSYMASSEVMFFGLLELHDS